ncbi:FHA domain-containing protein [Streptomyces sp. TRM 70351]|uniref:FHA domain-containing protein n=1 Tax=Streptomyces sp. TRM 70351 TaxID=3116552 RepID=UPI002E7BE197|nr:FHA domain-containing protein [Streptomyces sp. TRM 70351]MEE1928073.1 FHA domain-containing protein [Streptomyces sp. TRM 70351]
MPNQIRLTVRGPHGGPGQGGEACDVLVTAPPGTVLAAVTGGLATALAAAGGGTPAATREGESAAVYAGARRLDAQRQVLGEPPLVDGAVLSLYGPAEPPAAAVPGGTRLHVVSGPDAGGVHLLHPGQVRIGRSADADVVLDDPDVSRLHCVVTVTEAGAVGVADLGSTNGTAADGVPVGERPVPLRPGASLRLGESVLRLRTDPVTLPEAEPLQGPVTVSGYGDSRRPTPLRGSALPYVPEQGTGLPEAPGRPAAPAPHGTPQDAPAAHAVPVPAAPPASAVPAVPGGSTHGTGVIHSVPRQQSAAPVPPAPGPEAYGPEAYGPQDERRNRGIGGWARRLTVRRQGAGHPGGPPGRPAPARPEAPAAPRPGRPPAPVSDPGRWPDPADVLLTALGPGPRLWERGPGHEDALTVRIGTAHHAAHPGTPLAVPLREAGSLGLAGPRPRLLPLARSVLAQLATLHPPGTLEIVLLASGRTGRQRVRDWSWLGWLPHLRPAHGQNCRLLFAFDREQATARTAELVRRVAESPLGPGWGSAERAEVRAAAERYEGPATVLVVDGEPGTAALRETVAGLAAGGAAAGVHVLCLADTPPATPTSPQADTLAAAYAALPAFRECGAVALLSGAVATAVRLVRRGGDQAGEAATVDGVSAAWAERVARALAPLREPAPEGAKAPVARPAAPLPDSSRLLDELGLARATPAALLARWPDAAAPVGAGLVLGAGPLGPLDVDLAAGRSHLLVSGAAGSGKTELLASLAASLAAGERPDRLGLVLVDGAREGLGGVTELPHAATYLCAGDPVRMRAFAQALSGELKRRAEVLGEVPYEAFTGSGAGGERSGAAGAPAGGGSGGPAGPDTERGTLRLRPRAGSRGTEPPLPRLVVLVDDFDALVAPELGNPGRPAAGSVVRALEAVAREGLRLGVHLVSATGRPDRTAQTAADQGASLRVALGGGPADGEVPPGRGVLHRPDGSTVPFQGSRVTARIPRTATQRPTVVPLEWARAGDPPARRPVRELGNGPTDLALLASAVERAAREAPATPLPPLL